MRYTNDTACAATTPIAEHEVAKNNPSLGEPAITKKLTDYTVQMGGPIKKDKAFFFASVQRYHDRDRPRRPASSIAQRDQPALQHEGHASADAERHDRRLGCSTTSTTRQGRVGFTGPGSR